MKTYILNGFMYPLDKYFPNSDKVKNIWRWNWNKKKAIEFADTIKGPCQLIGFSDGATAALEVANNSIYVQRVYCHSCMYRSHEMLRRFEVVFFRTNGDTTPTYDGTEKRFLSYKVAGYPCEIMDLDPVTISNKNIVDRISGLFGHQFENAMPYIKIT
jgi:hypothetical protein